MRILERRRCWLKRQPRGWFHCRVGKVQLQSFTFTWGQREKKRCRSPRTCSPQWAPAASANRRCTDCVIKHSLHFSQTWEGPPSLHVCNEMASFWPHHNMSTSQCLFIRLETEEKQLSHQRDWEALLKIGESTKLIVNTNKVMASITVPNIHAVHQFLWLYRPPCYRTKCLRGYTESQMEPGCCSKYCVKRPLNSSFVGNKRPNT